MALYVPASSRRRRVVLIAVAALVGGLLVGAITGRVTAPGISDRINSVRDEARKTSAALRVIVLHDQAALPSSADKGADLVLQQTRTELDHEFSRAPWLTSAQHDALVAELDALAKQGDHTSSNFGQAAEKLAAHIDATFAVPD